MKRLTIICLFAIACLTAKSQELKFNQNVLLTFSALTTPYISGIYTVPAGKTWKIESGSCFGPVNIREVNGLTVNMQVPGSSNNTASGAPVWFPAGTTLKFYNNGSVSTGYGCFVSILEFDVIP